MESRNENKLILLVEDEVSLRQILAEKLTIEKYSVIEASNGKEALELSLERHPDLILLDIVMPVMDGLSMLQELRKDEWGADVPVILLTNLNDSTKEFESMEMGAFGYLVKADWKIDDVIAKITETLGT